MGRRHRYLPGPSLVEVTTRTIQGRHLLRPSPELNEIIGGCLGRALEVHPLELVAYSFLSNHVHLLLYVENHQRLSQFMAHLNGNLAKEISRLTGFKEKVWGRRFDPVLVSDEPAAQIGRLKYLLSQGVKEDLVENVLDWPGVHAAHQLVHEEPLKGVWHDRTKEWAAWRRRISGEEENENKYRFATHHEIELAPLPCWRHLSKEEYRDEVTRLITDIETEAAAERARKQKSILGAQGVLDQNPLDSPRKPKKSPRPLVHAATREVRDALWTAYREFEAAYSAASKRWLTGERGVEFPEDCFPPALPFTGESSSSPLPPPVVTPPLLTAEGKPALQGKMGCKAIRVRTRWWSAAF